jgi:hypothetical protein
MRTLVRLCLAATTIAVGIEAIPQAKGPIAAPPNIPVTADFVTQPQPGLYGDGAGPYIDGIGGLNAGVSGSCDTISFRTVDSKLDPIRSVIFDFTGYSIDNLGIETAGIYSYTKSQQNVCVNDLRTLQVGQSRVRYTYMHWQNAKGEYRVRWSDVRVTCTYRNAQCTAWTMVPISSAEVLKVTGVRRAQFEFESKGFFDLPFELALTAQ